MSRRERTVAMRPRRCLNPRCDRNPEIRGLCEPCYQGVRRLVINGTTTWKELEDRGKVERTASVKSWVLA